MQVVVPLQGPGKDRSVRHGSISVATVVMPDSDAAAATQFYDPWGQR
jgi:hypothetical protein